MLLHTRSGNGACSTGASSRERVIWDQSVPLSRSAMGHREAVGQ
jgi:hypothetical protein